MVLHVEVRIDHFMTILYFEILQVNNVLRFLMIN